MEVLFESEKSSDIIFAKDDALGWMHQGTEFYIKIHPYEPTLYLYDKDGKLIATQNDYCDLVPASSVKEDTGTGLLSDSGIAAWTTVLENNVVFLSSAKNERPVHYDCTLVTKTSHSKNGLRTLKTQ